MEAQSEENSRDDKSFKATPKINVSEHAFMLLLIWHVLSFSNEDVAAVRVRSVTREEDSFIFASIYMAQEKPAPPEILKELVAFSGKDNIPSVIGTDANAHHTVWGSTNVNLTGMELLTYSVSTNLYFCNVGNKPTFRTKIREEMLDLTLTNRNAWSCIRD